VQVRASVPVVLVSNATTRLERDLVELGLSGAVDGVVSSAGLGITKPDLRVFLAAARLAGAEPSRCLFVDDTAEHVLAAASVGMRAIRYQGVDQLRSALGPLPAAVPAHSS
jgi:putative hydrolase of the HAD superfamily